MYLRRPLFPNSRKDALHLEFFAFHVGVDVPLESDVRVGVAQYFAQRFDVAPGLQAGGGKGVAQGMGMHPPDACPAQIALNTLAVAAWLHRLLGIAGEKPDVWLCIAPQLAQQNCQVVRNGDFQIGRAHV